jgi:tetratricopeptide (TPR) repeat protein
MPLACRGGSDRPTPCAPSPSPPRAILRIPGLVATQTTDRCKHPKQEFLQHERRLCQVEIAALDEAMDIASTAVALAQANKITTISSLTLLTLGNVQRAMGVYQTARNTHEQALANDAQMVAQPFKATIAGALCADCVLAGEWATARDYAHVALDYAAPQLHFYDGFHHMQLIEALLAGDEVERAAEEVERFGARIGANPRLHIVYLQSLAALADWRGETAQAAQYRREAAITWHHD